VRSRRRAVEKTNKACDECPICLIPLFICAEDFESDVGDDWGQCPPERRALSKDDQTMPQNVIALTCGHMFHAHWIRPVAQNDKPCPTCRTPAPLLVWDPKKTANAHGLTINQFAIGQRQARAQKAQAEAQAEAQRQEHAKALADHDRVKALYQQSLTEYIPR